LKNNIVF